MAHKKPGQPKVQIHTFHDLISVVSHMNDVVTNWHTFHKSTLRNLHFSLQAIDQYRLTHDYAHLNQSQKTLIEAAAIRLYQDLQSFGDRSKDLTFNGNIENLRKDVTTFMAQLAPQSKKAA